MTTQELIIGITLKISNNVKFRTIDERRILYFLNFTQQEMITDSLILSKTSNSYEYHNASYELIQPFITSKRIDIEKDIDFNTCFFSLPSNYLLMLSNTQLINSDNSTINTKVLKTSVSSDIANLPYYKNNNIFINVLEYNNRIYLQEANPNIIKLYLFYIRQSSEITINNTSELNLLYHVLLLEKTVSNILKSFEDINSLNINETKI